MTSPIHIRVASRYLKSRRLSQPIRSVGATLARNIVTWLEKKGPDVLDKKPLSKLQIMVPRIHLHWVSERLQKSGVYISASKLGNLRFRLVERNSYFSPNHWEIGIKVPYHKDYWDVWLQKGGEFEQSFVHEFVHAMDFHRGNPKAYGKEVRDDPKQYITHPLEVNARIQELMNRYDQKLEKYLAPVMMKSDSMDTEDLEWELLSHLNWTTTHEIEDILYKLDGRLEKQMREDVDLRKKILKRLYTEMEESKNTWRTLMNYTPPHI